MQEKINCPRHTHKKMRLFAKFLFAQMRPAGDYLLKTMNLQEQPSPVARSNGPPAEITLNTLITTNAQHSLVSRPVTGTRLCARIRSLFNEKLICIVIEYRFEPIGCYFLAICRVIFLRLECFKYLFELIDHTCLCNKI